MLSSFIWLEWPSTHECTIQKTPLSEFMDGMKLSPRGQFTWLVFFFLVLLFSAQFLLPSSVFFFFFPGDSFYSTFFLAHPWIKVFFGKLLPTSNLPTTLLPTNPPPSLMLLTPPHPTICVHFQCPPMLFSPSSSLDKWALPSPSQEELRRRARELRSKARGA